MIKKKTQSKTRASTSRRVAGNELVRTSPLRLIRPSRLARLLDCDPSTIWRYEQDGTLPPPIQIAGIKGWPETELLKWLEARRATGKREQAK